MTMEFSRFNPQTGLTKQVYLLTFLFKKQVIFTGVYGKSQTFRVIKPYLL